MKVKLFPGSTAITATVVFGIVFSSVAYAAEGGSAKWSKNGKGTIVVTSGTFEGNGKDYGKIGSGSQAENQPAVFELMPGTNLKNVVIVPPAGDGIHVHGNNRISNVTFTDVGEDAISMRSSAPGGTVIIENSSFSKGDDKIFQANKSSVWYIKNCKVNGAGKVFRQNGGTTFKLTIFIDGLDAKNFGEAIVRSDASACTVYYRNLSSAKWVGKLKAIAWDGKSPSPPTLSGGTTSIIPSSFGTVNKDNRISVTDALLNAQYYINTDQVQFYDLSGKRASIITAGRATPAQMYLLQQNNNLSSKGIANLQK